jgi:2-dehydropantoate 2-reductase
VVNPNRTTLPFDLIIVALKHHHLLQTVSDLKNLINEQTTIISVMNGLDSETVIGSVCGMAKILYTISVGIDAVRDGNNVTYSKPGIHYFGEADNHQISERVQLVKQAFEKAGINYEIPVDMMRMIWWKFMINVGMNPTSAVMRAPYGLFRTSSEAMELMKASMGEVISLAKAENINLTEQDVQDWIAVLNSLSPDGKTSMLQDLEAGLKTEVEIFCEKVVDLGKTHNIPTPVNQTLLRIVRVLEKKP